MKLSGNMHILEDLVRLHKRFLCLTLLALLSAFPVQARDAQMGPLKVLREPIKMDWGASPLLSVTFNHSTHKSFKCRLCHHMEAEDGGRYVACTTDGCHDIKGARERDPMSMFMAYHDPEAKRSCYGCHRKNAGKYPNFQGCRPCHMSSNPKPEQTALKDK